jgi:salicylate hydroxylase
MKQYRILIAGAGLGGLTAASCLMKAGHQVEIYEQAPQLGEIGAGIQVSANAMHVMRHLGIEDRLVAVGVKPEAYVFRLHNTGEVIQRFSLSQEQLHGAPYTQLHRAVGQGRHPDRRRRGEVGGARPDVRCRARDLHR